MVLSCMGEVEPYLEPIMTPGGDFTNGAAVIRGGNWEQPEKTFIRWAEASRGCQVENTFFFFFWGGGDPD